jgi:hypothetical protein
MSKMRELWDEFKLLFEPELAELDDDPEPVQEDPQLLTTTRIKRQSDGTVRWFSVSAVSALNRSGEIDSRALFDSFERLAVATGKYPERDFMHFGKWGETFRVGQTDFIARDGNALVTSGLYYDTELARAEIAARQANPDDWGDSVEYILLDDPDFDGGTPILNMGFLRFIATVPEKMAASHFTSGTVDQEVDRMAMSDEQLQVFADLFGNEEKAREWLTKHVGDDVEAAIEDAGMMTRTIDDDTEPETPDAAPPEDQGQDQDPVEFELDDAAIDAIVARLAGAQQFVGFNDALQQINERLERLEQDDDERQREWYEDMPRSATPTVRVTHRPSQATRDGDGDYLSMTDQAEEVVGGWNTDEYKEAMLD